MPPKEEVHVFLRMQNPGINKDDIIFVRSAKSRQLSGQTFILELGATGILAVRKRRPGTQSWGMADAPVNVLLDNNSKGESHNEI